MKIDVDGVVYDSILEMLQDERIFNIEHKCGYAVIWECCDNHYRVHLTKDQMAGLAEEITEFTRRM